MGRNLLAGRGWVGNREMLEQATRAQHDRRMMIDLADLPEVDRTHPAEFMPSRSPHSPGYSTWFAISYWLGGSARYRYSQRMQAALDAFACVLLFAIGCELWTFGAGVTAALIYALWPAPAFLANLTVAAATDGFWFIAVAYGALRAWRDIRGGRAPYRGATIVGVAALCGACMNSTSFVLPFAVACMSLIVTTFDRRAVRLFGYMVAVQIVVAALLMPWALRNQRLYGQFTFVRGSFWQLAWAAFGELPNPWGLGFDDKNYWNWIEENCASCNPGEEQQFTRDYILRRVVPSIAFGTHLGRLVMLRAPRLFAVAERPDGVFNPADPEPVREALNAVFRATDVFVPVLFGLALVGSAILIARRDSRASLLIGLGPTIFLTVFSLLFYVELRKTMPGLGFLCVPAGVAVVRLGGMARQVFDTAAPRRLPMTTTR